MVAGDKPVVELLTHCGWVNAAADHDHVDVRSGCHFDDSAELVGDLTVDVQQIHVQVAVVYVIVIEGEQYRLDRLGFALDAPSLFHADPLHYFQ